MIQWIITIIIVVAAITYAGYLIYSRFRKKPVKDPDCNSCASDCTNCPLMEQSGQINRSVKSQNKDTLWPKKKS